MSPHAYSEDQRVEQPAIGLFDALGWQTVSAPEETFGAGGMLGTRPEARWCCCRACPQASCFRCYSNTLPNG